MNPRAALALARLCASVEAAQTDYDAAQAEDPTGDRTRRLAAILARLLAERDMLLDDEAERRRRRA